MTTPRPASAPPALQDILAEMMGYSPECERFAERIGTALAFPKRAASAQVQEVEPLTMSLFASHADYETAIAAEPHCSGHTHFDIDCLDCSDALERQRKPAAEPVPCVAADDTPSKSRAKRIRLENGESVAVAQGEKDWKSIAENTAAECERMRADHARIVADAEAARERAYDNRDMALQAAEHEKNRADALEASLAAYKDKYGD